MNCGLKFFSIIAKIKKKLISDLSFSTLQDFQPFLIHAVYPLLNYKYKTIISFVASFDTLS